MATIPKANVTNGNTILASDILDIIEALDGTNSYEIYATGSLFGTASYALNGGGGNPFPFTGSALITGSLEVIGAVTGIFTGSLLGTASIAEDLTTTNPIIARVSLPKGGSDISTDVENGDLNPNGFYVVESIDTTVTIMLKTGTPYYEYTFFHSEGANDVDFVAGGGVTIISRNSYLKMNGTGSLVVARALANNLWALTGDLKA